MAAYISTAAFSSVSICWTVWQWQLAAKKRFAESVTQNSTSVVLELAEEEKSRLIKYSPASTITFYRGKLPSRYLNERVREILTRNPYLTVRLQKPSLFSAALHATYDSNPGKWQLTDYIKIVLDSSISIDSPFQDIMRNVDKYLTKVGTRCINQNEVMFKVTLIQMKNDYYAVVVSLNHMLGDGYTFYKLCSMLSVSGTPYSLEAARNQSFKTEAERLLDPAFLALLRHPFVALGFLYNTLVHSPLKPHVCVIDKGCVEKEKAAYKLRLKESNPECSAPSFISTNDIITSWMVKFSGCSYLGMVVNFRNRLQAFTDRMAGNYTRSVMFCASDVRRAEDIRLSLGQLSLPPPLTQIRGRSSPDSAADVLNLLTLNYAGVTSWASFYEEVELPGAAVPLLHLPVMNLANMGCRTALIIFKCNKRDTAVVFWSGCAVSDALRKESLISRLVCC